MDTVSRKVWLVDDDADEHFLLGRALKRSGFAFEQRSFLSPIEALYVAQSESHLPDWVIVDMNMPGMDGIAFLSKLEEHCLRTAKTLPKAILLSSILPHDIQERARSYTGSLSLQEKPLGAEQLKILVQEAQ